MGYNLEQSTDENESESLQSFVNQKNPDEDPKFVEQEEGVEVVQPMNDLDILRKMLQLHKQQIILLQQDMVVKNLRIRELEFKLKQYAPEETE